VQHSIDREPHLVDAHAQRVDGTGALATRLPVDHARDVLRLVFFGDSDGGAVGHELHLVERRRAIISGRWGAADNVAGA
jgi:hypothetical protein